MTCVPGKQSESSQPGYARVPEREWRQRPGRKARESLAACHGNDARGRVGRRRVTGCGLRNADRTSCIAIRDAVSFREVWDLTFRRPQSYGPFLFRMEVQASIAGAGLLQFQYAGFGLPEASGRGLRGHQLAQFRKGSDPFLFKHHPDHDPRQFKNAAGNRAEEIGRAHV